VQGALVRRRALRGAAALGAVVVLALALAPAAGAGTLSGLHDARYCEIIELHGLPPHGTATVWNTIGLNKCPASWWSAFQAGSLARELGATVVVLNGPRHFLMDSVTATPGRVRRFHGQRLRRVATLPIRTAADLQQTPYTDRIVERSNVWRWRRGRAVYELVAPGGDVYVMQAYSQIRDPKLRIGQLRGLGRRLALPAGWRYRVRRLARPLALAATGGRATILQDELQNTYQLAKVARPSGPRRRHAVSIQGRTKMVTATTPGTVEDHGTVTGTPFGDGRVTLVGRFGGGKLDATFRLLFPRGSISGTASLPFTISGGMITFEGTAQFTSGTGVYRGITSGALEVRDTNTLDGQNGRLDLSGSVRF
jgi:hypothetical protein